MSVKIVGSCEKCDQERAVQIAAYPYISSATNQIMVKVVAACEECGQTVDWTWASLPELRPDWTEYEKARKALEADR